MAMLLVFALVAARALYVVRRDTRSAIARMPDVLSRSGPTCLAPRARTPPAAFLQTVEHAWRNVRTSGLIGLRRILHLLLILSALSATACTRSSPSTEVQVRTALNLLAEVIDPAYELAMNGCVLRGDAVLREGEAGNKSATATEVELAAISTRCHRVRETFELMRVRHDQARALVATGLMSEAKARLADIQQAWRELRETVP